MASTNSISEERWGEEKEGKWAFMSMPFFKFKANITNVNICYIQMANR